MGKMKARAGKTSPARSALLRAYLDQEGFPCRTENHSALMSEKHLKCMWPLFGTSDPTGASLNYSEGSSESYSHGQGLATLSILRRRCLPCTTTARLSNILPTTPKSTPKENTSWISIYRRNPSDNKPPPTRCGRTGAAAPGRRRLFYIPLKPASRVENDLMQDLTISTFWRMILCKI